ncbi:hypothetical protein [Rheinheimera aquimaris]|uniref:hypothetical protein n=1 Tax=Rheinheimera aquimaris TaxID=412437 RepID=UPI001E2EE525|nr:hypothetical protein [Rheinheimera aquimaris]MCD1597859.1 hypothetical protein [Rheinheimera aquimaris]
MAQPVTVYRWDDAGAPSLTNRTPLEVLTILKKCLVEGYGEKAPLGWTMPFEDAANYKAVFRNNPAVGSGSYVQARSANGTNNSNIAVSMTPAKFISDVDTLVQPGLTRPFSLSSGFTAWVLIGTATGFYLLAGLPTSVCAGWASNLEQHIFVGDIDSLLPNDAGRFVVVSVPQSSGNLTGTSYAGWNTSFYLFNAQGGASSIGTANCRLYDADNFDGYKDYVIGVAFNASATSASSPPPSPLESKLDLYMRPFLTLAGSSSTTIINTSLTDRFGNWANSSQVSPTLRGFLPGFIYELAPRYATQNWPVTELINDQEHWLLRNTAGLIAGFWLNMEEW